jgi:hypothetical protein
LKMLYLAHSKARNSAVPAKTVAVAFLLCCLVGESACFRFRDGLAFSAGLRHGSLPLRRGIKSTCHQVPRAMPAVSQTLMRQQRGGDGTDSHEGFLAKFSDIAKKLNPVHNPKAYFSLGLALAIVAAHPFIAGAAQASAASTALNLPGPLAGLVKILPSGYVFAIKPARHYLTLAQCTVCFQQLRSLLFCPGLLGAS